MSAAARMVNVQEFIDQRPLGRFQLQWSLSARSSCSSDGFDTQAIGTSLRDRESWHVQRRSRTGVRRRADGLDAGRARLRSHRRPLRSQARAALLHALLRIMSLLTATASSLQTLLVFRFVTGLGLGGAMPNAIALTTEYAPRRVGRRPS